MIGPVTVLHIERRFRVFKDRVGGKQERSEVWHILRSTDSAFPSLEALHSCSTTSFRIISAECLLRFGFKGGRIGQPRHSPLFVHYSVNCLCSTAETASGTLSASLALNMS